MSFEIEAPIKGKNAANSRFIEEVREEGQHNGILDDVFMRTSSENPYHLEVRSCIELSHEIKEESRQRSAEEKRRQQLRESSQELKTLESQLRAAYVRKAMCAQMFEQQAIKEKAVARGNERKKMLMEARLTLEQAVKKAEDEDRAKKEAHKMDLIEQMEEMKLKKLKQYKKVQDDRKRMDDIVRQCNEDKKRENLEAADKKARTKEEMDEFLKSRKEWKLAQSQATEEENERLLEVVRQRERDQEQARQEKKAQRLRKEQWSEEMGRQIHAAAMEKIKARDTLAELLVDERQANQEIAARKELELQMQNRNDLRRQMEHDFEEKLRRKEAEQRTNDDIFQEQMRVLAERDKLDQLSDEKRRRKQMEHRKALLEAFDEKKRLKAKRMALQFRKRDEELATAAARERAIEAERIRMIKEHASGLVGYLAPGVLRESDKKFLSIPPT